MTDQEEPLTAEEEETVRDGDAFLTFVDLLASDLVESVVIDKRQMRRELRPWAREEQLAAWARKKIAEETDNPIMTALYLAKAADYQRARHIRFRVVRRALGNLALLALGLTIGFVIGGLS